MKLNLLSKTKAASGGGDGAPWGGIIGMVVLGLLGVVAALAMTMISKNKLEDAKTEAMTHQQPAADAVATANQAEAQIASAQVIIRNQKLAEAMDEHNFKYVELYNDVRSYVPSYYRLVSMQAQPAGNTSVVTLTGQLKSFAQYADLAIAMWKHPDVISVTRSGYQIDEKSVPALNTGDQLGLPLAPGESPLPVGDIDARISAMEALAASAPRGFQGLSNFGSLDRTLTRGPLDGYSTVVMTLVISKDIRVPDPRATVLGGGGNTGGPLGTPGRATGFNTGGGAPAGGQGGMGQLGVPGKGGR